MRLRNHLTTGFFIILFVCGLLAAATPASANPLSESLKGQIQDTLVQMGVADVQIDLNVQIPVTKAENPVGYDSNLWATAIYHKSPVAGTASIKRPTIFMATAYRREIMGSMRLLFSFLSHGYNIVMMDMRGTGSGEGVWSALDPIEQYDVAYMVDKWIPSQLWSDGKVGMVGGSYEAIIQYLAAGLVEQEYDAAKGEMVPKHLKAITPLSAYNDVYKDIVIHGGNFEMEFMAVWIAATDLLSVIPPDLLLGGASGSGVNITDIQKAIEIWGQHINQLGVPIGWIMDPTHETKGRWYEEKSPMIYWPQKPAGGWNLNGPNDKVGLGVIPKNLPVFTATGWFDIFTRGSLLNYEYGLKNHSVSDKAMIVGPWYHFDAAFAFPGVNGLGLAGKNYLFSWDVLRRWFDWKIKGVNDPFMQNFPVLLYVLGEEKWRAEKSWPLPSSRLSSKTYYLSKARPSIIFGDWFGLANAANNYRLVSSVATTDYNDVFFGFVKPKANPVLYHNPAALNGLMSRSAQRWFGFSPLTIVTQLSKYVLNLKDESLIPWEDERNDETGVLTFTTEPLSSDLEISGPLKLTFWAKTKFTQPATQAAIDQFLAQIRKKFNIGSNENLLLTLADRKDVQWVIEVNDVFPTGRARNITSGWLSAAFRPYDPANPTQVDPTYKAFDPFYSYSDKNPSPIAEDTAYQYVVEVWPTTNVFKRGHRIRVSISGSDFPHLFPVLRPSANTIVIDEAHRARLDFTAANQIGEGTLWKWIDGNVGDYMLTHKN
jgi:hypothetical protein